MSHLSQARPLKLWLQVREGVFTLLTAGFFARFVYADWQAINQESSIFSLLFFCAVSLDLAFTITRRAPTDVSISAYAWAVGIVRTILPLSFRPTSELFAPLSGGLLLCTGIVLQLLALASLGRSLGIVAANRGVRTKGMYRFVRHPLYFSYCLSNLGFTLACLSLANVLVCISAFVSLLLSIRVEERLLRKDAKYCAYCQEIAWRLVPKVF